MRRVSWGALFAVATWSGAAAAETVSYSYDAKGRLITVQRSGGPAAGLTTQYALDKADNRSRVLMSQDAAMRSSAISQNSAKK
jgi:YD repeat-containing protein